MTTTRVVVRARTSPPVAGLGRPAGALEPIRGRCRNIILGATACNVLLILAVMVSGADSLVYACNLVTQLNIIWSCAFVAVHLLKANSLFLWTPLPWFALACSAYYGFGPLLYAFGSEETVAYCESWTSIDSTDLLRTNLLNSVCIFLTYAAFTVFYEIISARPVATFARSAEEHQRLARRTMLVFLAIGLPIKYLFDLPYEFGLTNYVLPGVVKHCSIFTSLACFISVYLLTSAGTVFRKQYALTLLFVGSELFVALLKFNKQDLLVTLLLVVMSLHFTQKDWRVLLGGCVVFLLTYFLAVPFTLNGRTYLGLQNEQGLEARATFFFDYATNLGQSSEELHIDHDLPGVSKWWARMNYANAQTFALREYDNWRPGHTFALAAYTVIPRWVWPEKPIMTAPGEEFNYAASGVITSKSAPGVFAEAYWNGGPILTLLTCIYVGALYSWFTTRSLELMTALDFRWLPCALFSMLIGFRIDGWFSAEFVGAVIIFALFYHILKMCVR